MRVVPIGGKTLGSHVYARRRGCGGATVQVSDSKDKPENMSPLLFVALPVPVLLLSYTADIRMKQNFAPRVPSAVHATGPQLQVACASVQASVRLIVHTFQPAAYNPGRVETLAARRPRGSGSGHTIGLEWVRWCMDCATWIQPVGPTLGVGQFLQ